MRIPHIIYENTIKAFEIPSIYLRNEQIKCDNFTWDVEFIPKLRDLALNIIVENWQRNPLYKEILIEADKLQLLELLPTDLPLELTVPIIKDDFYWKRCYKARWPNAPEPFRRLKYHKPINIYYSCPGSPAQSVEVFVKETSSGCPRILEEDSIFYNFGIEMADYTTHYSNEDISDHFTLSRKSSLSFIVIKSWKQTFLQKFVEEEIERMKPDMFNPEYIKELTDLYGEYIICLNLSQLQTCKNEDSYDHISLHSLLARLTNLIEFTVCFNKGNLVDNFTWHSTKLSETDCELLGKGVAKSNLKILRVLRSNIDSNKIKFLLRPLVCHKFLHTLDLSHCKISDEGAKAIAGMLKTNTVLENLILVNNEIGPEGAQGLAYYLCQHQSKLIELNLKLNPLYPQGGKYIGTALARGAKSLRSLNISCCGLTSENLHLGLVFSLNDTLQKLDLSNNNLGEISGANFLTSMAKNTTLIHIDLRMCGLAPEAVQEIESQVRKNLESWRKTLITPPSAEDIL